MLAELRYAARSFVRTPGLTAALLATIALGIGANAAVRGFIRGLVISSERPASVTARAVTVFARDARLGFRPLTYDEYARLAAGGHFELIGAAQEMQISGAVEGRLQSFSAARITPSLATLLQLPTPSGALLSERLWRTEYRQAGDPDTAVVRIEGTEVDVDAVAPEWLDGLFMGRLIDVWLPLDAAELDEPTRRSRAFWVFARLADGAGIDRVHAAVSAAFSDVELALVPYTGMAPDAAAGLTHVMRLLPGAAGLVFLIACANVMAFLLSRAAARAHETSMRVALGAGRRQLVGALLADSVLIAVGGGACGALLAFWTAGVIPALFFDQDASQLRFAPHAGSILVTALACAVVVTACGLGPLIDLRHDDPAAVLRRESAGPSRAVRRLRSGLVIAQMACCSVLIVATGVLLDGFRSALRTTAGRHAGDPVVARVEWKAGFDGSASGATYFEDVEKSAMRVDGVMALAWTSALPGARPRWESMRVEPAALPMRPVELTVLSFTPDTLREIDLPPVAGRLFGGVDNRSSCAVALLDAAAAEQLFRGDAVGRRLLDSTRRTVQVVGVVRASRPRPARPSIWYYADQMAPPLTRNGVATFMAPVIPARTSTATVDAVAVSPGYFDRLEFSAVSGAVWTTRPPPHGCREAVVNQEAAERYFDGRAVGAAVIDAAGERTEIVGVVHAPPLRTSQRVVEPTIYLPMTQEFLPRMTLIVSARQADEATLRGLRRALGVPESDPLSVVMTLDEYLSRTALATERIATVLIGAAAALALSLAALGIYGAMSDAVGRRRREFALRIALGAQQWRVVAHVLADAMRLTVAGTAAGVAGSIAATYWLTRLTPAAGGPALATLMLAPVMVALLVLVACVLPARRAVAADPLAIMRDH